MNTDGTVRAMLVLTMALASSAAAPAPAAGTPDEQPATQASERELDEVLVKGRRAHEQRPGFKELQKPLDWLARLVGRFVVDGYVDLHGAGNSADILKVQGHAECVGFGVAPGVHCELKIRWPERKGPDGEEIPGGVPNLNPAVVLYGYEPVDSGIQYIMVDSKGAAEDAMGLLVSADTMQSRTPCVTLPGNCERVVRITAWPDLRMVEMRIDLEVDRQKSLGFLFMMRRVPGSPSVVFGRRK